MADDKDVADSKLGSGGLGGGHLGFPPSFSFRLRRCPCLRSSRVSSGRLQWYIQLFGSLENCGYRERGLHRSLSMSPQNCRLRACRRVALGSHAASDNVNPNVKFVCLLLCPVIMIILANASRRGSEAKRHSLAEACVNRKDEGFCASRTLPSRIHKVSHLELEGHKTGGWNRQM